MAKRRTQVLREPTNSLYVEAHNATLITPNGNTYSVNISPEAAALWTKRYGIKVEWFATDSKVAA